MRNERFASKEELKNNLLVPEDSNNGGYVLFSERGKNYLFPGEGNMLTVGVPGTGKTRRSLIPTIQSYIRNGESMLITDPKGEIYDATRNLIPHSYKVCCLDFRDVNSSTSRVNPLITPYKYFRSNDPTENQIGIEMVHSFCESLISTDKSADVFWPTSARNLVSGIILAIFLLANENQVNLVSVFSMLSIIEKRCKDYQTVGQKLLEMLPSDSTAAYLLKGYIGTEARDTRAGVYITAYTALVPFVSSEAVKSMLAIDNTKIFAFDGTKPLAFYLILPDETNIYDKVAGTIVTQVIQHFMRIAYSKYKGTLPIRLHVCLDELGQIGTAIPLLSHYMAAGRSRNIQTSIILQSLSQLDQIYGANAASAIRNSCDLMQVFRTNDLETLRTVSALCGEKEVITKSGAEKVESLITPAQLSQMKTGQALVWISGRNKYVTQLPDYTETCNYLINNSNNTLMFNEKKVKKNNKKPKIDVFDFEKIIEQKEVNEITGTLSRNPGHSFDIDSEITRKIAEIDARIAEIDGLESDDP